MAGKFINPCRDKSTAINLESAPVKLIIGKEEHNLFVHDSVLRKSSKFFQAALNEKWAEGQEREVKLPEEELETVATYLHCFYSGTIASKVQGEDRQTGYIYLSKLYGLGERLIDSRFQNIVIDAIVGGLREKINGIRWQSRQRHLREHAEIFASASTHG